MANRGAVTAMVGKDSSAQTVGWCGTWERQRRWERSEEEEKQVHRGREGVVDVTWMKRRAEAQLVREGACVADAALQSPWRTQDRWEVSDSGGKWPNRNGRQSDHTEQRGSGRNHGQNYHAEAQG